MDLSRVTVKPLNQQVLVVRVWCHRSPIEADPSAITFLHNSKAEAVLFLLELELIRTRIQATH